MTIMFAIPGVAELVGKGIYQGMPADVPSPVRDGHAVIVGEPAACASAARQLADDGWRVTIVTRRGKGGTEVVCASGIHYLEALVLRRIHTGRLEACNASALFIL